MGQVPAVLLHEVWVWLKGACQIFILPFFVPCLKAVVLWNGRAGTMAEGPSVDTRECAWPLAGVVASHLYVPWFLGVLHCNKVPLPDT